MVEQIYLEKLKKWYRLYQANKLDINSIKEYVDFFSKSKLPNEWFLQQFSSNCNKEKIFYYKGVWNLFALVLVKRGIKKIEKNLVKLLEFLYEPYFDWYRIIQYFILKIKKFLKKLLSTLLNL